MEEEGGHSTATTRHCDSHQWITTSMESLNVEVEATHTHTTLQQQSSPHTNHCCQ